MKLCPANRRFGWACRTAVVLCVAIACRGGSADADDEPAVVWQPADASGAEGSGFKVTMRISSTEVTAEEPLTLTVRVTATSKWQRPPRRTPLWRRKEFNHFEITPSPTSEPDRVLDGGSWEFDYRLRPRSAGITKVPGLAFRYYNPEIPLADRRWQTTYADPVPLTVLPRPQLSAAEIQGDARSRRLPATMYQFAEGPALLKAEQPFSFPGPLVLASLLLIPPLACIGGVVAWCRLYPGAAKRARRRNSRAARQALAALGGLQNDPESVRMAAAIVTAYLRQRVELPPVSPVPDDIAARLQESGFGPRIAAQSAEFFRACDAVRFARNGEAGSRDVASAGLELIQSLEGDSP